MVTRVAAVDGYRGLVMLLMMGEVLQFCEISTANPVSSFWKFLCHEQSHVPWVGCSLHDLIAPSFYFLVGMALHFSLAKRSKSGQPWSTIATHSLARGFFLVLLGMVLQYVRWGASWSFEDTLTQIGLAYFVAFFVAHGSRRTWWLAFAGILVIHWIAFAAYPIPGPGFRYDEVGVSPAWLEQNGVSGFAAHWQKNSNLGWAIDTWFLNLFPRATPFTHSPLGLTTVNFFPTSATMILGVIGAEWMRNEWRQPRRLVILSLAGVVGIAAGVLLGLAGVCPVVKAIWTPSWVLFSGGWCFLLLVMWYVVADVWRQRAVVFPFAVVGANSLLAYMGFHLFMGFAYGRIERRSGKVFQVFGAEYETVTYGVVILILAWMGLYFLYRKKWFIRL